MASSCSECPRPKIVGSSRYCEYHRLLRTSYALQVAAAVKREKAAAGRLVDPVPGVDEMFCVGCRSLVPEFYAKTRTLCVACSYQRDREARVQKTYGLGAADLRKLEIAQGGRCAICRAAPGAKALAVDHDHRTGKVRGLLCERCNHVLLGLGAGESPYRLMVAAYYLMNPPSGGAWKTPEGLDFYITTEAKQH